MLKNDRLGTKTWRLVSLLACAAAPFAGCSAPESSDSEPSTTSQAHGVVSDGLVISQVYGGGGNAVDGGSASYTQDFVELFNRSAAQISLAGLSIQYGAEKGAFANNANNPVMALPDKTIPAGGYFLIALAGSDAGASTLPTPDATGTNNLSASGGKLALVRGTDSLACGGSVDAGTGVDGGIVECDTSKIIDLVGYGKPNYAEGSPAAGSLGATQSIRRKGAGCAETDSNKDDFEQVPPMARNSATSINACALDAGAPDAEVDGGPALDAAPEDAGTADGGGGTPGDAGPEDAGQVDGGGGTPEDAGTDSATPDDGGTDAAPAADAGPGDASTDSGTQPIGTGLVISQAYGSGGSKDSAYKQDFVELFNRGDAPVSLAGLSIQYGSAAGVFANSSTTNAPVVLPDVLVPKGGYFLVGLAQSGDAGASDLPTPDLVGPLNLSGTNGKVALARIMESLNCGPAENRCPPTNVVDMIGYGTASDYEATATAALASATPAALRNSNGCVDSNNNKNDFTLGAATPRNSKSPVVDCSGVTPTDGGTTDSGTGNPDSGTGRPDAGKSDAGTGNPFDSGTPPRNDGGSGNGAVDVDSGCSCSTPGSSTPMNKGLAFGTFAALGLAITARRRRAS